MRWYQHAVRHLLKKRATHKPHHGDLGRVQDRRWYVDTRYRPDTAPDTDPVLVMPTRNRPGNWSGSTRYLPRNWAVIDQVPATATQINSVSPPPPKVNRPTRPTRPTFGAGHMAPTRSGREPRTPTRPGDEEPDTGGHVAVGSGGRRAAASKKAPAKKASTARKKTG